MFARILVFSLAAAAILSAPSAQGRQARGEPGAIRQDFAFNRMDLRAAFKALSVAGQVDIVLSPAVGREEVTLDLTDKTWQEAMLILCQMFNLKYTVEKSYLYVQKMADYNKVSLENATAAQQSGSIAPLSREIVQVNHAKAKDLEPAVKGLLSSRGKITVVERNNALIIFDTRANIAQVRRTIHELDIETHQITIQARLVQVNSDALREIGVDWELGSGGNLSALRLRPGATPSTPEAGALIRSAPGGVVGGSQSGGAGAGAGGATGDVKAVGGVAGATSQLAFGLFNGNLGVAVANLINTAQGEVLAQPQITTLDNMEAYIFLGEEVPQRVLDQRGVPGIVNQEAGTELRVTPHITGDGRILLDLYPQKNNFRSNPDGTGFIIERQRAKTTVVVNDGETVVIAGLTSSEQAVVESGIPFLKDIPILGYLFKRKRTEMRKRDLIIFVTPHIVKGQGRPTPGTVLPPLPGEDEPVYDGNFSAPSPTSSTSPTPLEPKMPATNSQSDDANDSAW